jgi:hypothetical protein
MKTGDRRLADEVENVPASGRESQVYGLVSAIIPVHNRPRLVVEAVDSVLSQTYRPIETIIVDDGSTDETSRVCDQLASRNIDAIRVIHQENRGPGVAREAGRSVARGEFIQYLDSDDILLPHKFERQVSGLRLRSDCGVSYGRTRYRHANGLVEESWKGTGNEVEELFPSFLVSRWWGTSTPLYRRAVSDQTGPWLDLRNEEDWEYDCRIASRGIRLHFVPEAVSEERDHGGARLSRNGSTERTALQSRARAHLLILNHARNAGITDSDPEMQHFARELFLLSRQCGAARLERESAELFEVARQASGETRARGWDFRIYGLLAGIAGWTRLGKLACQADNFRK